MIARGLTTDFTYTDSNDSSVNNVVGGFVACINAIGGPLYPGKQCCVRIGYFNSLADCQADPVNNVLPYEDDTAGLVMTQYVFTYVHGVDEYDTAFAYLQTLFPAGTEEVIF